MSQKTLWVNIWAGYQLYLSNTLDSKESDDDNHVGSTWNSAPLDTIEDETSVGSTQNSAPLDTIEDMDKK